MKKQLIQYGWLVIANVVIGLLLGTALGIHVLLEAPIMAAIPVLFALPGLLLQPWSLLIFLAPELSILYPFIISGITLYVYGHLNQKDWFKKIRQRVPNWSISKWLWSIGSMVIAGLMIMLARFKDIPPLKTGLSIYDARIKTSLSDFSDRGQFYQLPSFINSEGLWKVKVNPSELAQIRKKLELRTISKDKLPEGVNGMPPYWWQPNHNPTTQYLSTHDVPFEVDPALSGSFHAIVIWNPGDQNLYMWYKTFS